VLRQCALESRAIQAWHPAIAPPADVPASVPEKTPVLPEVRRRPGRRTAEISGLAPKNLRDALPSRGTSIA